MLHGGAIQQKNVRAEKFAVQSLDLNFFIPVTLSTTPARPSKEGIQGAEMEINQISQVTPGGPKATSVG